MHLKRRLLVSCRSAAAIVDKLASAIEKVVSDPEVSAVLALGGYETVVGDGKSVSTILKSDVENWRNLVAAIGIEPR